jgi:hypothetical protein
MPFRCKEDCCAVPLRPDARVAVDAMEKHKESRLDPKDSFWRRVRGGVSTLTREEVRLVSHLKVVEPPERKGCEIPLEKKLREEVEWCLLGTAPRDQFHRCMLLSGPSGCGKTHSVENTATRCGLKCISVTSSQIMSKWVGEAGKVLAAIFRLAAKNQPAIIFIDECEQILQSRSSGADTHTSPVTAEFLTHLQGTMASQPGVIVMCCTNHKDNIDAAVLDRFGDQAFDVPPPTAATRRVVWENVLARGQIKVSPAELVRLSDLVFPSLRGISSAVTRFRRKQMAKRDTRTDALFQIAEEKCSELESDTECDADLEELQEGGGEEVRLLRDRLGRMEAHVARMEVQMEAERVTRVRLEEAVARLQEGSDVVETQRRRSTPLGEKRPVIEGTSLVGSATRADTLSALSPSEEEEEKDEEVNADEQPDCVLLDRLLRFVGFTDGRVSTNAVSYGSMQQAIKSAAPFAKGEIAQAAKLYGRGVDIAKWANGIRIVRGTVKPQLDKILKGTGVQMEVKQMRTPGSRISVWKLRKC